MNIPDAPITDAALRVMRDTVYPAQSPNQIQSDASWNAVKDKWRADIEWLTEEYKVINEQRTA